MTAFHLGELIPGSQYCTCWLTIMAYWDTFHLCFSVKMSAVKRAYWTPLWTSEHLPLYAAVLPSFTMCVCKIHALSTISSSSVYQKYVY